MNWSWMKPTLKVAEQVGLAAASTAVPGLGLATPFIDKLMTAAIDGIQSAAINPTLSNPEKKETALNTIDASGEAILQAILASGHGIQDSDRLKAGVGTLVEALVDIMKATGAMPAPAVAAGAIDEGFEEIPGARVLRSKQPGSTEFRVLFPTAPAAPTPIASLPA